MSETLSDERSAPPGAAVQPARTQAPAERTHGKRGARRVREIDFSRPTKFTQEQLRRVERAHDGFCRTVGLRLSSEARAEIELEVVNLAQLTWSAALTEPPANSIFGAVRIDPLGTHMLVSVELQTLRTVVERMLGSAEIAVDASEREPTEIDLALSRRALGSVVDELSHTWEELLGVTLTLESIDVHAQNFQLAPPSEPTIALSLELRLGELPSVIVVAVPFRSIESEVSRLPTGTGDLDGIDHTDPATALSLERAMAETSVELRVEVAAAELTVSDVLALEPGDVVVLDAPVESGVTLYAETVPVHRARPGRRGGRRAIEVLERLERWP